MAPPDRPTCLSLCSGIGGLEIAAHRVLGARVLGYCEREAFAAAVLLARMEDESLEPAPIWCGNLEDIDAGLFEGVDLVTAGFPCQPFSVAGARLGKDDERWIWEAIAGILRRVRPRLVFLENVPPLVQHGLGDILGTLADIGLDATWDLFRASDVGAPQRRARVFILGVSDSAREQVGFPGLSREPERVADASRRGLGINGSASGEGGHAHECVSELAYAEGSGRRRESQPNMERDGLQLAQRDSRLSAWPPGPRDADGWREWVAAGGPQPAIRRDAPGVSDRLERLRALGNAVVPDQAELALRVLMRRLCRPCPQSTTCPTLTPTTSTPSKT